MFALEKQADIKRQK